ncbi:putative ring finger domain-containing protein [Botrytis fragariae]|uniref:Putative ring finger domain-containing protein n=1 Tax=Botrytis fragariae TaxID=1964551 RepID=A0A8H6AND7_9HELO|nr:putative ring finger domain-containing protein [Botrytis fragariae]KAF5870697.1 putative ring finger domain-containing protein [Botrytis fragariae]
MNHHFIKNNGARSRTSLPSVNHGSLIQMNLTRHKDAFFFVDNKTSNNEETLSNEEGPSVAAKDDMPTNEESSDEEGLNEEGSDEDTQCQECNWNIHKAQQFVVLHPCNCIFHFGCIKDKFYEDPKCPKCNTVTIKHRRMTPLEGRFVDMSLELEHVKICIKNRRIYHKAHQSSAQEGHSKNVPYSRVDLIALRRLVYEKTLYCHSVRSGQALDPIEICKQIFRNDLNAKGLMRAWIRLEIQALKQITIVPDHGVSFENVVIATLQMENRTEEQKKKKDYAVHIVRNTLNDYTDLFLHSARAFLTSFCQTLEGWNRAATYPKKKPCKFNTVTHPSTRPSRPGLKRSSGPSFACMRWSPKDVGSSNTAQSVSTVSPTTAPQPVVHSFEQDVPHMTTCSFVAHSIDQDDVSQANMPSSVKHLEHISRSVTLSSTPASLESYPVLGSCDTTYTVTECLHSVQLSEANIQAMLANMEQSAVNSVVTDNVEDGQSHSIEDASPAEVGRLGKLSRKLTKISRFVRTSIKKSSIKKSSKGLDWEKEQDIR